MLPILVTDCTYSPSCAALPEAVVTLQRNFDLWCVCYHLVLLQGLSMWASIPAWLQVLALSCLTGTLFPLWGLCCLFCPCEQWLGGSNCSLWEMWNSSTSCHP